MGRLRALSILAISSRTLEPSEQKSIEQELPQIKTMLSQQLQAQQQVQAQEREISGLIAAEQGRWVDFNNRIDELERAPPPSAQR